MIHLFTKYDLAVDKSCQRSQLDKFIGVNQVSPEKIKVHRLTSARIEDQQVLRQLK